MKRKISRNLILIILVCIVAFFLNGCWDYREIERRGYALAVGIDKADNKVLNTKSFEYMPLEAKGPLYAFTIEVPIIARSMHMALGQSGSNADKERDWNLTVVSNTFFEANREFATRLDYPPFYSHLQAIVISEAVADTDMSKLLDIFLRDPEMRRRIKIFITPGSASDVLHVIPKIDDYSALYLRALPDNNTKTSRMLHRTDIGKVSEAINENRDFVLPKVVADKYEIKDAGCAVFKNNKMVGWLDEIKTSYLKWIVNYANGGTVTVNLPELSDSPVTLEIKKVKAKQRPIVKNDAVEMVLDVKAALNLGEVSCTGSPNVMNSDFISKLERLAEEKIENQIKETISYVQQQYGTDIFYFRTNVERFAPSTWDKVKDNWDDVFRNLKVTVNVKVKISQIGLIK